MREIIDIEHSLLIFIGVLLFLLDVHRVNANIVVSVFRFRKCGQISRTPREESEIYCRTRENNAAYFPPGCTSACVTGRHTRSVQGMYRLKSDHRSRHDEFHDTGAMARTEKPGLAPASRNTGVSRESRIFSRPIWSIAIWPARPDRYSINLRSESI